MEREARFHFEMFSVRPVSVSLVSSRFPSLFLTGFVFSRCYFPFLSFSFVFACVLALACVCVCVCVFLCVRVRVCSLSLSSRACRPCGRAAGPVGAALPANEVAHTNAYARVRSNRSEL